MPSRSKTPGRKQIIPCAWDAPENFRPSVHHCAPIAHGLPQQTAALFFQVDEELWRAAPHLGL